MLPAGLLWQKALEPNLNLRPDQVRVNAVSGSLWDGQALLAVQSIPLLLDWDVEFSRIRGLALPIDIRVESHAGQLQANLVVGLADVLVDVDSLRVDLNALNPQFKRRRITLDGEVFAKGLVATVSDQKLSAVSGRFNWSGGNISYPVGRNSHERLMPAFSGQISTREDGLIELGIMDQGGSVNVIEGSLLPDGVGQLQVRRRLLDLADEPWSSNSTEQDVVFKVKKSIY